MSTRQPVPTIEEMADAVRAVCQHLDCSWDVIPHGSDVEVRFFAGGMEPSSEFLHRHQFENGTIETLERHALRVVERAWLDLQRRRFRFWTHAVKT